MKIGKWVKQYRERNGLSMQAMADLCGFSKAYIGMLEKGINNRTGKELSPTIQTFNRIATATGIDLDKLLKTLDKDQSVTVNDNISPGWILNEANYSTYKTKQNKPQNVRVPVLGTIVAGVPIEAVEEVLDWEEIPESMAQHGEYFALRVKGHSMEPKFIEGDTVIVKKEHCVDSGRVAVVLVNGEDATLKQINKSEEGITLIGYNPLVYEPHFYSNKEIEELPIQILGEVVELRRKI